MPKSIEFPLPDDVALPIIPVTLSLSGVSTSANALLDTGATVNVLPYDIVCFQRSRRTIEITDPKAD